MTMEPIPTPELQPLILSGVVKCGVNVDGEPILQPQRSDVLVRSTDGAEAQSDAAGQSGLLRPRQRVEQDAVHIAIQALEV